MDHSENIPQPKLKLTLNIDTDLSETSLLFADKDSFTEEDRLPDREVDLSIAANPVLLAAESRLRRDRLVSLFNSILRCWDNNLPGSAMKECTAARELLLSVGLPTTCVDHCVTIMRLRMSESRALEQELVKLVKGNRKNSLPVNYKLATLYYDRRMLKVAETHLMRSKELASTLIGMEEYRQRTALSNLKAQYENESKSHNLINIQSTGRIMYNPQKVLDAKDKQFAVIEDLDYVKKLQKKYCRTEGSLETLPCLFARFDQGSIECCKWKYMVSNGR